MSESCIFCEGFHDRAFWAGMLEYLQCIDPGARQDGPRVPVLDPWGMTVRGGGHFAFITPSDRFLRVVPCEGKSRVLARLGSRLEDRETKAIECIVVNTDTDAHADDAEPQTIDSVLNFAKRHDPSAETTDDHTVSIDAGATRIVVVRWSSPVEGSTPGLPNVQTLERVICSAIIDAHPERGDAIEEWLKSRPAPPEKSSPKEHALSHLAGWYAEYGSYDVLCRRLWEDEPIRAAIVRQLEERGLWAIIQAVAE